LEEAGMKQIELVVIGGSAGSLDVIMKAVSKLKTDFNLPLVIVIHRKKTPGSSLAALFAHKTNVPVKEVDEKDPILTRYIYLAPADYHLLIENDRTFSIDSSEKVHYSRPSIDVTFQSAAETYKDKLACILVSGANADGTNGLRTVKNWGGITAVQNPDTAEVSFMPRNALTHVQIDHVLEAEEIPAFINNLP
jgi:two-component system chemotaxis response regulator CheB